MKKYTTVRPYLLSAGIALVSAATASAGVLDTSVFTAADIDVSGSLSTTEFNTTLEAGLSAKAQAKSFRRADSNRNGSIELNEFFISTGDIVAANGLERRFYRADVSVDGTLSFDEFKSTYKGKAPLVSIRRNFLRADVDESESVSLEEYLDLRQGQTDPVDFTIFELVDLDANGEVTLEEFSTWFPQAAAQAAIGKRFDRLDADADGVLTTDEWNPGVKP